MAASGEVMLSAEQSAALKGVLPNTGDSDTLMIAAGMSATREGVTFTCDSDYDCTVTVTNSLGTIVAMWESQTLGDGTASSMASGLEPPVDTFPLLNAGSTALIRVEVNPAPDATPARTAPNWMATELIGMDIGTVGVLNADMAGLRSVFDPNGAGFGTSPGDAAAAPGAVPTLTMGSTITGATDGIDPSVDMAPAPTGWGMKTLFRDWGDTAGSGDGGFETGAIVVKNLDEGTPHPFDDMLHDRYVNPTAQNMFDLTIAASGAAGTTSVDIDSTSDATNAALSRQLAAMVFDSTSLVPAQSQDLNVNPTETFTGTYFGAPGQFQCIGDATESCALARNDDGTVRVVDTDSATDGIQTTERWSFTPDDGAMITVPDQDWMAYGAWLTTPDDAGGTHRFGVFFNGMDPYTPGTNFTIADADGLHGSATYSGGATGVYVDGMDSGLFTARAMLTANFDVDGDGTADSGDYSISGRIHNFRGTNGVALGADTGDLPNPQGRGENDWVVLLNADAAGFSTSTDGAISARTTGGSADGVPWSGMWNGHFFGPAADADGDATAPSGVAGRFWANTGDPDGAGTMTVNDAVTSVVGAFGATKD